MAISRSEDFSTEGLAQQQTSILGVELATERTLSEAEREEFIKSQHQANRWTDLGSGMTHLKFLETRERLAPETGPALKPFHRRLVKVKGITRKKMDSKKDKRNRNVEVKLFNTWRSGDFGRIATSFEAGAVDFVDRLRLFPGVKVLDVACGTGNLAIRQAKREPM